MGISQTKRVRAFDNTVAANAQIGLILNTADDPCNIHGLITDMMIGQTGVGLSFGYWALCLLPRGTTANPVLTTTALNSEVDNPIFWMVGTWMTDDAGVVSHIGGAPRTSRNCPRGGRLVLVIANSALSGSTIRTHGVATWFETIK